TGSTGAPATVSAAIQMAPPSIETDASITSDVVQAEYVAVTVSKTPVLVSYATAVNACVPGSATELAECVTDSPGFSGAGSVGPSPVSESITTTLSRGTSPLFVTVIRYQSVSPTRV